MTSTSTRPWSTAPRTRDQSAGARDGSPVTATLDRWPSTRRAMPWLIAAFLVMVYLVPFDSISFPLGLPINSQFDRIVLVVIMLVWAVAAAGVRRSSIRFVHGPINVALFVFTVLCLLSIAVNLRDLTWDGELGFSDKQLALSFSYTLFFLIAASSLHRDEVVPLLKLLTALAAISALGTLYQYRADTDIFYTVARDILGPLGATVRSARVAVLGGTGRGAVVGPTHESLANATMLGVAVPFALAFMVRATRDRDRILWGLAAMIILAGCVATGRKTAFIVPLAAVIVMVCHEPRRYLRYWPLLIVAVGAIEVAAPHAISHLRYQFLVVNTSSSTTDRTGDYSAVWPYIDSHLLFGRGFGSFDPHKYRILDDYMLGLLVQIGALGTVAYAAVIGTVAWVASRFTRRSAGIERSVMSAAAGACAGFFISNFLYDATAFRQGPYVFFFIATAVALMVCTRARDPGESVAFRASSDVPLTAEKT